MSRDELIAWATRNGWKPDRWDHLQKELSSATYRLKLSRIAARYEVKSSAEWVRLRSGYYKDLRITPDDQLAGMTH